MHRRNAVLILVAGTIMALAGTHADACAVCFGDPDSSLAHGARWGIVTMLLVTYGLLGGMGVMLGVIMFRARRRHAAEMDGGAED